MSVITLIAGVVALLGALLEIVLVLLYRQYRPSETQVYPDVSVLVAMRNERENAARCLYALSRQCYAGKYEVLVGDDSSTDGTYEALLELERALDCVKVFRVNEQYGQARGKANAIAHLRRQATGKILLITDADAEVNPQWITTMAAGWEGHTGIVNGLTEVTGSPWQNMEWQHAQGMLHVVHRWLPVTAIGNNMGVDTDAYDATGGFSQIPFSLTEDRALTQAVKNAGYTLQSRQCSGSLAKTHAIASFGELLQQRKRWMTGAVQLPWWVVGLLAIQALYYPALLVLLVNLPGTAVLVALVKGLFQDRLIQRVQKQCTLPSGTVQRILFEFYAGIMAWLHVMGYLWPARVRWKGREFSPPLKAE